MERGEMNIFCPLSSAVSRLNILKANLVLALTRFRSRSFTSWSDSSSDTTGRPFPAAVFLQPIPESVNMVIMAAVALVVLIVLIAIFTGRLGSFNVGLSSCEDKGGSCESVAGHENEDAACKAKGQQYTVYRSGKCEENEICCLPI